MTDSSSTTSIPSARDVVKRCGGFSEVARAVNLTRQSVFKWRGSVPAEYVRTIAAKFGLEPSWIRPDLYG